MVADCACCIFLHRRSLVLTLLFRLQCSQGTGGVGVAECCTGHQAAVLLAFGSVSRRSDFFSDQWPAHLRPAPFDLHLPAKTNNKQVARAGLLRCKPRTTTQCVAASWHSPKASSPLLGSARCSPCLSLNCKCYAVLSRTQVPHKRSASQGPGSAPASCWSPMALDSPQRRLTRK